MSMTTRDRGDRYGPIEWAQQISIVEKTSYGVGTFRPIYYIVPAAQW